MGKDWDEALPNPEIFEECLRVLKPGGFAFVMSAPRSDVHSRMCILLEDAGFNISFTPIAWAYATGFPKALNVGKKLDQYAGRERASLIEIKDKLATLYKGSGKTKSQINKECGFNACGYLRKEIRSDDNWGIAIPTLEKWEVIKKVINCDVDISNELSKLFESAEREVVGKKSSGLGSGETYAFTDENSEANSEVDITLPATEMAQKFDGSYAGYQPKPAWESVIICMKPLEKGGYIEQAKDNAGGITWLDDVRVPFQGMNDMEQYDSDRRGFTERSSIKEGEVYSEAYGNEAQQWGFKKPISKDYEQYTKDNVGAQEEFNTDADGLSRGKHPSRKKKTDQEKFEAAKGNNPKNYKEGRGWDQWGLEEEKHNFSNLTDEEAIEKFGTLENYKKWRRDNLAPGEDRRLIDGGSWDTSKMAENVYSGGYSGKRVSAPMKKKKSDYDNYVEKQKSFTGAKTIGEVNEGGNTFLGGDMKQLDPSDTYQKPKTTKRKPRAEDNVFKSSGFKSENNDTAEASPMGRFPANLLVSDDVLNTGKIYGGKSGTTPHSYNKEYGETTFTSNQNKPQSPSSYGDEGSFSRYFSLDEWWKRYFNELPEEVQRTFPFLIVPKASKREKNDGIKDGKNVHPTCKPLTLFSYLLVLGSRKGDIVLDPFAGSGTTGIAAVMGERNYIMIEREEEYFKIMEARIDKAKNPAGLVEHDFWK